METKFIAHGYKYPVTIKEDGNRLWFIFNFNKTLVEQIRLMEGARYHGFDDPPVKQWTATNSLRNWFQIARLEGKNPYHLYDKPLLEHTPRRQGLWSHQLNNIRHGITRQYCIIAAEPALGKTLSAIEIIEWLYFNKGIRSWFYVGPKSALISVRQEFEEWKSLVYPQFFTYEALKSIVENWPANTPPPQAAIFDESQRLKNPTAQRSIAAKHLAESIRKEWGEKGAVILMTGTPSPNNPGDWWHQTEVVCPGYLIEGDLNKFRKRLAVLDEGKSDSGQTFLSLKGWRDSDSKCAICGQLESEPNHDEINATEKSYHAFQKGVNEVSKLYERLKGLVVVNLKKECLDLPDKIFKIIECKPTQSIINAAKLITAHAYSVIQTMTLLRELSDGFQYQKVESGTETCPICEGSKIQDDWIYKGPEEDYEKFLELQSNGQEVPSHYFEKITIACRHCDGTGESVRYGREVAEVPCPKEDRLIDLIDEYEDVGRMVTYAGFTGSVDRVTKAYLKMNWEVIRVDGRGWWSSMPGKAAELYKKFKYDKINHPRVGFVAHPMSGGTGLNLQVAPVAIFYSNDFNGESRQQAVERIHRPGMDVNRGATIIDLIHLPTDKLVLDNLEKKRKLQSLTLGEFKEVLG